VTRLRRYQSACHRIRAEVWHMTSTQRMDRNRQEWPELWEAVDEMVALLDEDHPPRPLPSFSSPD
jgi:hypothetical protein